MSTQSVMEDWEPLRDEYLDILLELEGPPNGQSPERCCEIINNGDGTVRVCDAPDPIYRCVDCLDHGLPVCRACCVARHTYNVFHRVQVRLRVLQTDIAHHTSQKYNNEYYAGVSLMDLGVVLYLGHHGRRCPATFLDSHGVGNVVTAFHTNGWHRIRVCYCGCSNTPKPHQLLRASLYPATTVSPKTVFTIDFLNTFHLLTLQGKLSLYDYYETVLRLTDNMGNPHVVSHSILIVKQCVNACK